MPDAVCQGFGELNSFEASGIRLWCVGGRGPADVPAWAADALAPATIRLFEWTEYWLKVDDADEIYVGERRLGPIQNGLFRFVLENRLGLVPIRVIRDGRQVGETIWAEVVSPKFPTLEAHLGFLGSLIEDLFARAARLPFAFSAETARGVTAAMPPPTPLFAYHFFCQHAPELRVAWAAIEGAPHRRLHDREEVVPLAEVSDVDADTLLGIIRSPERWAPARGLPVAARLRGFAPVTVEQRVVEETFDTPENRFVLACLRAFLTAVSAVPGQPWWASVSLGRRRTVVEMRDLLRETVRRPLFAEVGELHQVPSASRVLQRREGYRDLYRLWLAYQRARRPLFGRLQQAIDLRDIATLYEVWAFFALVEEIGAAIGEEPAVEMRTTDERGLEWLAVARFGRRGQLVYNQSRQSYSQINMRPDFLWAAAGGDRVAFDAKFRLERAALDPDDPTQSEAQAKHEDLYRMHAYRDGLGVLAAVVVYPGDWSFFDLASGLRIESSLSSLLLEDWTGIGAMALSPV